MSPRLISIAFFFRKNIFFCLNLILAEVHWSWFACLHGDIIFMFVYRKIEMEKDFGSYRETTPAISTLNNFTLKNLFKRIYKNIPHIPD